MPLLIAPLNQNVKIVMIQGDSKAKLHLEALGLVKGSVFTLLSRENGGCIIRVNDSRLALDRGISSSIMVDIA